MPRINATLNMFLVVFDVQLVDAFLFGSVADADGSVAIVLNDRLVNLTAWHFYFTCSNKKHKKSTELAGNYSPQDSPARLPVTCPPVVGRGILSNSTARY